MSLKSNFELMARYNRRINQQFYEATSQLSHEELTADRGAFFKSILGTFNHILIGDTIWLQRFAAHPAAFSSLESVRDMNSPNSLDTLLFPEFGKLKVAREEMDAVIDSFVNELTEQVIATDLHYQSTSGDAYTKPLGFLIQHFFNHQTHHRGQITTLLSQAGIDPGVTDLLMSIPDTGAV